MLRVPLSPPRKQGCLQRIPPYTLFANFLRLSFSFSNMFAQRNRVSGLCQYGNRKTQKCPEVLWGPLAAQDLISLDRSRGDSGFLYVCPPLGVMAGPKIVRSTQGSSFGQCGSGSVPKMTGCCTTIIGGRSTGKQRAARAPMQPKQHPTPAIRMDTIPSTGC